MNWAAATTPEPERVAGQLQHEPRLGDRLHPRPDQGDPLAGEEEPVVAVAERAHGATRRGAHAGTVDVALTSSSAHAPATERRDDRAEDAGDEPDGERDVEGTR